MIDFIGAFLGASVGVFAGLFGWHWYTVTKLEEEIKKMPIYLKSTILQTEYEI